MKFDKSLLQRETDKFVVHARELSSRGTSFLIVILGVVLQASHTTLLMYNVSSFSNVIVKGAVSLGIGIFISMALAVFTLKHDGKNEKIESLINIFFYFEVFTNLFYYFDSILLKTGFDNLLLNDYIYFVAALPFAYIMPYAIKQFAGIIASDQSVDFGSIDVVPAEPKEKSNEQLMLDVDNEVIGAIVEDKMNEILSNSPIASPSVDYDSIEQSIKNNIQLAVSEVRQNDVIDENAIVKSIENKLTSIVDEAVNTAIKNTDFNTSSEIDVDKITSSATAAALEKSEAMLKKAVNGLQQHFDVRYIQKGGKVILRTGAGQETTVEVANNDDTNTITM